MPRQKKKTQGFYDNLQRWKGKDHQFYPYAMGYLPRVDEAPKQAEEKKVLEELPRGDETIPVVEDEEKVLKLVSKIPQVQGYKVLEAPQGSDALLISKQHEGRTVTNI